MSAKDLLIREAEKAREQLRVYKEGYEDELKELMNQSTKINDRIKALVAQRQTIQPRLEKRVNELNKAMNLTEQGMDPLIAKITAPVVLEEEAREIHEWDDLFDAIWPDDT